MTAVVGLVANGHIWMGGDAAGTNSDGDRIVVQQPKIFHLLPEMIIGSSGTFRIQNLLRYQLKLPKITPDADLTGYLVTHLARRLRKLLSEGGSSVTGPDGEAHGAETLIGLRGRLFMVQSDFSVVEPSNGMCAAGSGSCYALGALFANCRRKPEARLYEALEAAATYHAMVTPPFTVLRLEP